VVTAGLDPVRQRPSEGGSLGRELVNSVFDEIGGLRVGLAQRQVPCLYLMMQADLLGHTVIMTYQSCLARSMGA
jgi:hypothetical protein